MTIGTDAHPQPASEALLELAGVFKEEQSRDEREKTIAIWLMHEFSPLDRRISLDPIAIDALSEAETVEKIAAALAAGRGGWIVTANLDHYQRARVDSEYLSLINGADLVVADGMPLVWAAQLHGTPLPGRVAGSDLIHSVSAEAARAGHSVFLLGGTPGTADAAGRILRERHPSLEVAGTYFPPFGFEQDEEEIERIRAVLIGADPDIVYVALGSPKQERLIQDLRSLLPRAWWLGVGISFSFITGEVKRAPRWMQRIGAEWVHRLIQEPGRLARRYLVEGIPCAISLLWRSWRTRRR